MQDMHEREYVAAAAEVAVQIHSCKPPGDILVFLAGQAEVENAVRLIHQQVRAVFNELIVPVVCSCRV